MTTTTNTTPRAGLSAETLADLTRATPLDLALTLGQHRQQQEFLCDPGVLQHLFHNPDTDPSLARLVAFADAGTCALQGLADGSVCTLANGQQYYVRVEATGATGCLDTLGADWTPPREQDVAWLAVSGPTNLDRTRPEVDRSAVLVLPSGTYAYRWARARGKRGRHLPSVQSTDLQRLAFRRLSEELLDVLTHSRSN